MNNRGIFRQCIFASLEEILANVKNKPFIGLQLVVMCSLVYVGTHEGNKSHSPSRQADNPYLLTKKQLLRKTSTRYN